MSREATRKSRHKSYAEMSRAELDSELERITGLPCPPHDAPNYREQLAQYDVASAFLMAARGNPDLEEARIDAANAVLQFGALPIAELLPHLETAMGRKLAPSEIQGRMVFD